MLQRGSTERPQCVLQALGQCHKALTAEHDRSVLPPREGQTEVIEPVIQRHTGDADAVIAHLGEIGKPQPARRMLLPEDDVLLGAVLATITPASPSNFASSGSRSLARPGGRSLSGPDSPCSRAVLIAETALAPALGRLRPQWQYLGWPRRDWAAGELEGFSRS